LLLPEIAAGGRSHITRIVGFRPLEREHRYSLMPVPSFIRFGAPLSRKKAGTVVPAFLL
jgi:hypothetical protein